MIPDADVIFEAGGRTIQRLGTIVRRTMTPRAGGEEASEAETRNDALGYSLTRSGLYMPTNVLRSRVHWYDVDGDGTIDTPLIIVESSRQNQALQSSNLADSAATWAGNTSFTITSKTSIVAGQTAFQHVNDGGGSRSRSQDYGTLTGAEETVWAILENVDATVSAISLHDATAATDVHLATLTWATGAMSTDGGSGATFAVKLMDKGPNGGVVYLFGVRGTGTVSNTRRVALYPTGTTTNTATCIVHHVQGEDDANVSPPSFIPIVTAGAAVTRAAETLQVPFYGPMAGFQIYCKFKELGGVYLAQARIMHIGTTTGARVYIQTDGTVGNSRYQIFHHNGTTSVSDEAAVTPSYGDTVEVLGTINADGSVLATVAINGTTTNGSVSAALTPGSTWGANAWHIGNGGGSVSAHAGHVVQVATRGVGFTLDDYRLRFA